MGEENNIPPPNKRISFLLKIMKRQTDEWLKQDLLEKNKPKKEKLKSVNKQHNHNQNKNIDKFFKF